MYSADAPMYSAETIQLYERRAATFAALAAAADKLIEPFLHMTLRETYESANFYRYHKVVRICDKLKAQAKRMNRVVLAMKRSNEGYDRYRGK